MTNHNNNKDDSQNSSKKKDDSPYSSKNKDKKFKLTDEQTKYRKNGLTV